MQVRKAIANDMPALMSEFYAESGYELDCVHAERAFLAILADERLHS